jgi:hypothetical protein
MNTSNTCQEKNKLVPTHIPHFKSHTASVASRDTKTANLGKLVWVLQLRCTPVEATKNPAPIQARCR